MAVSIYSVKKLLISFSGIPLKGFARGTQLVITDNSEAFKLDVGNDGEGVRSATGNFSCRMVITLMQSSKSNLALSIIHQLDRNEDNGAGVGVFNAADLSGASVFLASEAWIVGNPEQGYDDEAKSRAWTFETVKPSINIIGGN